MAGALRIEVMHGVNLDVLERRDPGHYGAITLRELEQMVEGFAGELGMEVGFFQSNSEGELVEHLHGIAGNADGVVINAGAWSHYSWGIRDALELARLPAVEVHLSDLVERAKSDPWRGISVFEGLCLARIVGKGPDGYRLALEALRGELRSGGE